MALGRELLDVPFAETARRMAERDGSNADPEHPSMRRYIDGQRRYLTTCDPRRRAMLVVDNSDPRGPRIPSSPISGDLAELPPLEGR